MIDTSVFIALEQGRALGDLPRDGQWYVSAITIGELKHGALSGADPRTRSQRLDSWSDARNQFVVLDIDETIANTWGEYRAIASAEDRRIPVPDSLIAATAATWGYTLVTQDRGFAWYPDLDVLVV